MFFNGKFPARSLVIYVVYVFIVFCVSPYSYGQSGRRAAPTPVPTTTTPSQPIVSGEDKPSVAEPGQKIKPPNGFAIPSILVAGEVVHKYAYYSSNDLDQALKECVNRLTATPKITNATRIGKLDYTEAKARAKQETDTYILWISFITSVDGLGNMILDYADYAILTPNTATRLTSGRVKSGQRSVVATGGVIGLPTGRNGRPSSIAARHEMREIARQIPGILMRGGWLAR